MLTAIKPEQRIQGETIDFTMLECGGCGIPFFVPTQWKKKKVNEHASFSCPNGCNRRFIGKSDAELLQEKLEEQRRIYEEEQRILQDRLLDEINEKKKIKKDLTRLKNGVCPCCNRSFHNLQQHIANEHPELIGKVKVKRKYTKRK